VFASTGPVYPTFSLVLPTASLVGYGGGSVCSLSAFCAGNNSSGLVSPTSVVYVQSGTVGAQFSLQGGSSAAPVPLPAGFEVAGLTGTIGGGLEDYYLFSWAGGAFSATASVTGAPNPSASYLFSLGTAGNCNSSTAILDSGNGFASTIGVSSLAAGTYCVGLDANNPNDPMFGLTFNTPVSGTATPEPSGAVYLLTGLGLALASKMFKRQRRGTGAQA
jgi:hypothetical protein